MLEEQDPKKEYRKGFHAAIDAILNGEDPNEQLKLAEDCDMYPSYFDDGWIDACNMFIEYKKNKDNNNE